MHKGGLGPWFCALYFNLANSKGIKKQTDLRVHTYPLLFERVMNGPKSSSVGNHGWVIIMMVGHFDNWNDAVAYHTLWASQTRGKFRRIQRGLDLFNAYRKRYKLKLWAQPLTRIEAIKAWNHAYKDYKKERASKKKYTDDVEHSIAALFANQNLLVNSVHTTQLQRKKIK